MIEASVLARSPSHGHYRLIAGVAGARGERGLSVM